MGEMLACMFEERIDIFNIHRYSSCWRTAWD